jgi:hypothetical protein
MALFIIDLHVTGSVDMTNGKDAGKKPNGFMTTLVKVQ